MSRDREVRGNGGGTRREDLSGRKYVARVCFALSDNIIAGLFWFVY